MDLGRKLLNISRFNELVTVAAGLSQIPMLASFSLVRMINEIMTIINLQD